MTKSAGTPPDNAALARKFFDCIEGGDIEGVIACCDPDIRIWHNTDGKDLVLADQIAGLRALGDHLSECRFKDRRTASFDGGFVLQYTFWARTLDGGMIRFPACVVGRVRNGRIERLDEYLDSSPTRPPADAADAAGV
jgi:ketosteroid isomerase-like protein